MVDYRTNYDVREDGRTGLKEALEGSFEGESHATEGERVADAGRLLDESAIASVPWDVVLLMGGAQSPRIKISQLSCPIPGCFNLHSNQ